MKRLFVFIAVLTMALISAEFPVFADPGASAKEQKGASPAFSGVGSYPKSKPKASGNAALKRPGVGSKGWGDDKIVFMSDVIAVLNSDYSVNLYKGSVDPNNEFDTLRIKRNSSNYPYYQIGLTSEFSMFFVNKTHKMVDLFIECPPPDGKGWTPYFRYTLKPGEKRYAEGLYLKEYTKFNFVCGGMESSFILMVH